MKKISVNICLALLFAIHFSTSVLAQPKSYFGTTPDLKVNSLNSNATELEHYNAAGMRINANSRGIHIIRMSDGSTRKVMK